MEDLKKLYPNSFDRLGSLKGAYNIRIDPSVKPATHARRKVAKRVQRSNRQGTRLFDRRGNHHGAGGANTLGLFIDISKEAEQGGKGMSGSSNLNKAIIREHHKPMTVEEIAHELAGATVYTKARCFKGISSDTSYTRSFSLDDVQLSPGTASFLANAFWSQNEPRRVSATDGCHS